MTALLHVRCHFNCHTSLCPMSKSMCFWKWRWIFTGSVSSLPLGQLKRVRGWYLWLWNKVPGPKGLKAYQIGYPALFPWSIRKYTNPPSSNRASLKCKELKRSMQDDHLNQSSPMWYARVTWPSGHIPLAPPQNNLVPEVLFCHTFHVSALQVILEPWTAVFKSLWEPMWSSFLVPERYPKEKPPALQERAFKYPGLLLVKKQ